MCNTHVTSGSDNVYFRYIQIFKLCVDAYTLILYVKYIRAFIINDNF